MPEAASLVGLRARTVESAKISDLIREFETPGNVIVLDVDAGILYGTRIPPKNPSASPSPFGHGVVISDIQVGPSGLESLTIHDPAMGASQLITDVKLFETAWQVRNRRYTTLSAP